MICGFANVRSFVFGGRGGMVNMLILKNKICKKNYMSTYLVLIKYNKTEGKYKCFLIHITSIIYDTTK